MESLCSHDGNDMKVEFEGIRLQCRDVREWLKEWILIERTGGGRQTILNLKDTFILKLIKCESLCRWFSNVRKD